MMTNIIRGLLDQRIKFLFRYILDPRSRSVNALHQPSPIVFSTLASRRFMGGVRLNTDGLLFTKRATEENLQGLAHGG